MDHPCRTRTEEDSEEKVENKQEFFLLIWNYLISLFVSLLIYLLLPNYFLFPHIEF